LYKSSEKVKIQVFEWRATTHTTPNNENANANSAQHNAMPRHAMQYKENGT
jgi:hypothetical protein